MIDTVVAEHSILFLGSGFSTDARNRVDRKPPSGNELRVSLARRAGVSAEGYSLTDLAEYCAESDPGLIAYLYDTFRIKSISNDQAAILAAPWKRIYTTNFDDAAEFGRISARLPAHSFSFEDERPRRIPDGAVIHLHGTIRSVSEDEVLEKVVLSESAYVRQFLERSSWYDQFLYDLRFSSACYFVGYSLSDQHIAALLTQNPENRTKTFFIEPDRIPDKIFAARVQKYGEIEPIGVEGFANLARNRISPPAIADFHALRSFRLLDTHPDKRAVEKPTVTEVRDFLVHGKMSMPRLLASLPGATYGMPRERQAVQGCEYLGTNRSLIIDSRLGNGKSVFQLILFSKLAEKGYRCLVIKNVSAISSDELVFLQGQRNIVIFFDSYPVAQLLLEPLAEALPNAKFVVEVRSSLLEVRLFEIDAKVPRPYKRISLNRLDPSDYRDFIDVCRNAGIAVRESEFRDHKLELRDLLIRLFQSPIIRERIQHDLEKALSSADSKKIIVIAFLMQLVQADIDADFLKLVSGVDPYQVLQANFEESDEIFSMKGGEVTLRSSIFAEFAMRHFIPSPELSSAIFDCAAFCASRKKDARYRTLLTLFMQYSRIKPLFVNRNNAAGEIRALYERLRWNDGVSDEPLFWLQFAILEIDEGHLSDAGRHLDYAYDEASKREGFLTHQIDTQYLRYLLETIKESYGKLDSFDLECLCKYIRIVGGMLAEDSHRYYAYNVLEKLPEAVTKVRSHLDDGDVIVLRTALEDVYRIIIGIPAEVAAITGSTSLGEGLRHQIDLLK